MNSNKVAENEDFTIEEHVAISNEEAFEFLFRNEKLQNFVERHNMIFIDGYFVIAAPKYIERSQTGNDAGIHITKWAKENLASCSINICKVHRNTRAEAGSEASFSKIQFPSFSINYDNGDNIMAIRPIITHPPAQSQNIILAFPALPLWIGIDLRQETAKM